MRQPAQRGVAPLNPDPKWPQGYIAVLREAGAVEKTISFLLTWVRRFFARFPGRNRRDLGRSEIEAFLGESSQRQEVSNWQIAQARNALELYYEQFRGIALAPRPDDCVDANPPVISPTSQITKPSVDEAASGTLNRSPPQLPEPDAHPPATAAHPFLASITIAAYHEPGAACKAILQQKLTAGGESLARTPGTIQKTPHTVREMRSDAGGIAPLRAVRPDGGDSMSGATGSPGRPEVRGDRKNELVSA